MKNGHKCFSNTPCVIGAKCTGAVLVVDLLNESAWLREVKGGENVGSWPVARGSWWQNFCFLHNCRLLQKPCSRSLLHSNTVKSEG